MGNKKYLNYSGMIEDNRKRAYVPPVRILWTSDGEKSPVDPEILVGCHEIQPYIHFNPAVCVLKSGSGILLDYGRELHGGIRLVTGSPRGEKRPAVRIRFGESASEAMQEPDNDHANHDSIIDLPAMGATEFGMTGFRFVRLDVPETQSGELELIAVPAVALYRDLEYAGSFRSSDERLNRIWETGAYTVHLNMQDYIYDGIKRDRLVWMGDMHPEIKVISAVFSDNSLVEKSLDFLRDRIPLSKSMNGISSYSCWWVICHFDWFMARGNLDYLRTQKEYLSGVLCEMLSWVDEEGIERMPAWRFLDWPSNGNDNAIHAGLQGLLAWALGCGEKLSEILGDHEIVRKCAGVRMKMLRHSPDCGANKAAAAMQVLGGIGSEAASNVLAADPLRGLSTFYGYYILQAKALSGDIPGALDVVRRYWGAMLDLGATTFWEDFDLDWIKNTSRIDELPQAGKDDLHADFGAHCYKGLRHSLCHGWAGGPTAWLSEHILGIKSLAPGMSRVKIAPHLAGLDWVEGTFPAAGGVIRCRAEKKKDGGVKLDYELPSGVEAVTAE